MDRQATFLLAFGLLIAAAALVSASGWILYVRERRGGRPPVPTTHEHHEAVEGH